MSSSSCEMLLSVVVPVYNAEKTILQCLASLSEALCLCPSAKGRFEVVCVDDGSCDSSAGLLDQLSYSYDWLKVVHQMNRGASSARNKGIDQAVGAYLTFLDSDDEVTTDFLSLLIPLLDGCSHDCVLYGIEMVDEREKVSLPGALPQKSFVGGSNDFVEAILSPASCYQGFVAGKVVRRSLLESARIRFDEEVIILEDEWFWLQVAFRCESVYFGTAVLYRYFIRPQSATSNINEDGGWADLQMRERIITLVRSTSPLHEVYAKQWLRLKTCALVRRFYVSGNSSALKRLRPVWAKARIGRPEAVSGMQLSRIRRMQIFLCDIAMLLRIPCAFLAPLQRLLVYDNARLRQGRMHSSDCSAGGQGEMK